MWTCPSDRRNQADEIDFATARDEGVEHVEDIISNYEGEIKLDREHFRRYLTETIVYKPSEDMLKGLDLYLDLAFKHGLIDSRKPLEFIK